MKSNQRSLSLPIILILFTFVTGMALILLGVVYLKPIQDQHLIAEVQNGMDPIKYPLPKNDGTWLTSTVSDGVAAAGAGLVGTAILFGFVQLRWVQQEIESYFTEAFSTPTYVQSLTYEHKAKILQCLLSSYDSEEESASFVKGCTAFLPTLLNNVVTKNYIVNVDITIQPDGLAIHAVRRSMEIYNVRSKAVTVEELLNAGAPRNANLEEKDDMRIIKNINLTVGSKNITIEGDEIPSEISGVGKPEAGFQVGSATNWSALRKENTWLSSYRVDPGAAISLSFAESYKCRSKIYSFRIKHLTEGFRVFARLIDKDGQRRQIQGSLFGNELLGNAIERHFDGETLTLSSRRNWLIPGSGFVIFPEEIAPPKVVKSEESELPSPA